jgi:hypothetical protein
MAEREERDIVAWLYEPPEQPNNQPPVQDLRLTRAGPSWYPGWIETPLADATMLDALRTERDVLRAACNALYDAVLGIDNADDFEERLDAAMDAAAEALGRPVP